MKILIFINSLSLGGTEKAACYWAVGLQGRGHSISVLSLRDGPRKKFLEDAGIDVKISEPKADLIRDQLLLIAPDVIHAHGPGTVHEGDVLGKAIELLDRKIPVVQTNVFGRLENPAENFWTDFRLFISWTSCVQAARRAGKKIDLTFFRTQSVAVYPVDFVSDVKLQELRQAAAKLRLEWGVLDDEILFGRFSRPEPNKWTDLPLQGFLKASGKDKKIKLLLREPPPLVAAALQKSEIGSRVLILPATAHAEELQISQMACDAVLHGSSIGESFGYGIAELMALAKPVVVNSTPWQDQAQIELVSHGVCGFQASTVKATTRALLQLAADATLRHQMGEAARKRISAIADPETSLGKLEQALHCAVKGTANPTASQDLLAAQEALSLLDRNQYGHELDEYLALFPFDRRVRFSRWRKRVYEKLKG